MTPTQPAPQPRKKLLIRFRQFNSERVIPAELELVDNGDDMSYKTSAEWLTIKWLRNVKDAKGKLVAHVIKTMEIPRTVIFCVIEDNILSDGYKSLDDYNDSQRGDAGEGEAEL
jgi:hypothetical protein